MLRSTRVTLLLALPLVLSACTRSDGGASPPSPPARPPAFAAADASQVYVLDGDKLNRFIAYQRATLPAQKDVFQNVARMGRDDALQELRRATSAQQAAFDDAAKAAALSRAEIRLIEQMVQDVALTRCQSAADGGYDFSAERKRYGAANVTLLVSRCADLTALYAERLRNVRDP